MRTTGTIQIPRVMTRNPDPSEAAAELQAALSESKPGLVVVFAATESELEGLGRCLKRRFGEAPVIGCTTAGEISNSGYEDGTIVGVALPSEHFTAVSAAIDGLSNLEIHSVERAVTTLLGELRARGREPHRANTFAFLLVDGLSAREELLASSLASALGGIQLFGGSAGDGLNFRRTAILHDGMFQSDRAVITLVQTDLPFTLFKTQHFVPTDRKMVVTGAIPAERRVTELNGEPAADEYARLVGLPLCELNPITFAAYPVVVKAGGDTFVRSIQKANEDGSLTFLCAIDEGIVLTVARGVDLLENLKTTLEKIQAEVGPPALILGCDCILRRLEVDRTDVRHQAGQLMAANNMVGFSTYGEQWNGMHVNQTLTGVAIGSRS